MRCLYGNPERLQIYGSVESFLLDAKAISAGTQIDLSVCGLHLPRTLLGTPLHSRIQLNKRTPRQLRYQDVLPAATNSIMSRVQPQGTSMICRLQTLGPSINMRLHWPFLESTCHLLCRWFGQKPIKRIPAKIIFTHPLFIFSSKPWGIICWIDAWTGRSRYLVWG